MDASLSAMNLEHLKKIFPLQADLTDYLILSLLHKAQSPMGSWALKTELDQLGHRIGTATIGRNLNMMDSHGYTIQISNKGRILTDIGLEKVSYLNTKVAEYQFELSLSELAQSSDIRLLSDILHTRKAIECTAARQAALFAATSDINELLWSVEQHRLAISRGNSSSGTGLDFHLLIAKISGNQVLYAMLNLLIHTQRNIEWEAHKTGTLEFAKTYADIHLQIVNAIAAHNASLSSQLMNTHLDDLIQIVEDHQRNT